MDRPTPTAEDQDARIARILAQMDAQEIQSTGKSLDERRLAWQKAWYLRYVVGPFVAGQLFDLWQWIMERVDEYLWGWAQQDAPPPPMPPAPMDPRLALRQALEKKRPPPEI